MEIFLKENDLIVSKTDLKGKILYGNASFIKISGFEEQELLNKPHNILRHQDMPKIIFKFLWERIQNKKFINAYVKNRTKSGDHYWVFANVTASYDANNNIIGYHSVRRKPSNGSIEVISNLYKKLLAAERTSGTTSSEKLLHDILNEQGVSYDEFIINLQK